ncbi:hypothetical protein ACQPZF_40320 [Actinosynnema sp. CS-041913]|uniref:hypothetical protein n=1 Tax=Actinosynnema sp. CS-041913 TaxID=3239917 RepID=UPI003D91B42D
MEPSDALRSIETALRLAIRQALGDAWLESKGAPDRVKLTERLKEESKRRDGAVTSSDLLEFTETYHLTNLILNNWQSFNPIFDDKKRTEAFFGVIEDVRNSVAHSRDLVLFERDLISGIAGMLRNQVALYRSNVNKSATFYPLIESIKDNFGREGLTDRERTMGPRISVVRLEVGDVLRFAGSAHHGRGKPVTWRIVTRSKVGTPLYDIQDVAVGDSVRFDYTISEDDVGEWTEFKVQVVADSRHHRYEGSMERSPFDDERTFAYAVNPPEDA